jgi:hypothetical protein
MRVKRPADKPTGHAEDHQTLARVPQLCSELVPDLMTRVSW